LSRTKQKKQVDVNELESIKSDLEYIFNDLNSDMGSYEEKIEDIESRADQFGNSTLNSEISRLKDSVSDLLVAEDEFAEIIYEIDSMIEEEESEEDDDE